MFGFDKMFDFNRDGKLASWERAAQFQFMDEMMKDDEKSIFDDDDEIDTFDEEIKPGFNYPDGIFFCGDICTGRNNRAERCGCNCAVYSNSRGFQSSSC